MNFIYGLQMQFGFSSLFSSSQTALLKLLVSKVLILYLYHNLCVLSSMIIVFMYKAIIDRNFRIEFCVELNKLIGPVCLAHAVDMEGDSMTSGCFNLYIACVKHIGYIKLYEKCIKLTLGDTISFEFDYFTDFTSKMAVVINEYVDKVTSIKEIR